jgi:hypothetical protein
MPQQKNIQSTYNEGNICLAPQQLIGTNSRVCNALQQHTASLNLRLETDVLAKLDDAIVSLI